MGAATVRSLYRRIRLSERLFFATPGGQRKIGEQGGQKAGAVSVLVERVRRTMTSFIHHYSNKHQTNTARPPHRKKIKKTAPRSLKPEARLLVRSTTLCQQINQACR